MVIISAVQIALGSASLSWKSTAPDLVLVPPPIVYIINGTSARLRCAALGNPEPNIDWLDASGTLIPSVPGVR